MLYQQSRNILRPQAQKLMSLFFRLKLNSIQLKSIHEFCLCNWAFATAQASRGEHMT